MLKTVACVLLLAFSLAAASQARHSKQKSSTARLAIEVTGIDTTRLTTPEYDSIMRGMNSVNNSSMVQIVAFNIITTEGKLQHKAGNYIVTPIVNSDHICPFDFKVGQRYELPAIQTKFTFRFAKKEFKRWHYKTSCRDVPVIVNQ